MPQKGAMQSTLILIVAGFVFAVAGGLAAYNTDYSLVGIFFAYVIGGKLGTVAGALLATRTSREWH